MRRRIDVGHRPQVSVPSTAQQHGRAAARERITSTANPRIKAIRALRERKEREKSGLFFVEGIHAVAAGHYYVTPSLTGLLLDHRARARAFAARQPGLDALTPTERRVLQLVAMTQREFQHGVVPLEVQLLRDADTMVLHGAVVHEQLRGNLLAGQPASDEL